MPREHRPHLTRAHQRAGLAHDPDPLRAARTARPPMADDPALDHQVAPQFTLFGQVDMTACTALRARLRPGGPAPTYNDLFVKACAVALTSFPTLNATYEDGRIVLQDHIDVAVVIAMNGQQALASVQDADVLPLDRVASETRRLGEAAWEGQLPPVADSRPATFTVSNLGMYGVTRFSGYVAPRQAAILSVGAIALQPVVTSAGTLATAPLAAIGLTCDHRVVAAADAAFFLERVTELLTSALHEL